MKSIPAKWAIILMMMVLGPKLVLAQIDLGFDQFLAAGAEDAEKLMEGYISPVAKGFGYGVANGWYTTAKPHKKFGFDFNVSFNAAFVPSTEETFTFRNEDYNNIQLLAGNEAELETVLGNDNTNQVLEAFFNKDTTIAGIPQSIQLSTPFQAPNGLGLSNDLPGGNWVPVPMVTFGIGLIKRTDIKVRFVPRILVQEDFEFSVWGVGIMHDIKQWIPGMKFAPFDLSVLVGYTRFKTKLSLEASGLAGQNQSTDFDVSSLTAQLLVGKTFSIVTFYAGAGYNGTQSDLDVTGTYELTYSDAGTGITENVTLEDPIDLTFQSSGFRATLGMRLQFAIFQVFGDYTFQEYNTLSFGLGFTVR